MSSYLALRSFQVATRTARCSALGRTIHSTPTCSDYLAATSENYSKLINDNNKITLVDVYTDWCPPCKMLSPVLKKLSTDPSVKAGSGLSIDVLKIDAEDDSIGSSVARQLKVRAYPTVVAFRGGQEINRFVGALNETGVQEFLQGL